MNATSINSRRPPALGHTAQPAGILGTIGQTPLIRLDRAIQGSRFHLYAKLEKFNPGGSIKDRSAFSMLVDKIDRGELVPGRSVVVESSSGNLAVGIAQICRYFGIRFICVVDSRTTDQNLAILRAFGASIELVTEADRETGEFLPVRIRRVQELIASTPHAFWPNQYANPLNALAHVRTMEEIVESVGAVDYLFCATSSCGTLTGCAEYVRRHDLATRIIAVDALGSAIFGNCRAGAGRRLIPGHGAATKPPLLDPLAADEVVHVSDLECIAACRRLVRREAILLGGSSGAVFAALERLHDTIPDGANCVAIFADGGERYLTTIYSDAWVQKHFGDVEQLWHQSEGESSEES